MIAFRRCTAEPGRSRVCAFKSTRTMIELSQLRYFLAAVEHGSFRGVASSVALQESTISRRIRDLEDHLGASLFIRQNGGVRLTLAGQKYVQHACKALRQIGQGAKNVAAIGRSEEGRIRIGIFSSLVSGFLFELLREFIGEHARVRIEFVDGEPADHVAAVRQLRLDVAFVTGTAQSTGCETEYLWSERVFAVVPSDHAFARRDEFTWQDVAEERLIVSDAAPGQEIHDDPVQRLANLGHPPEIDLQYVSRDNLVPLVAVGHGLTLTSEASTVALMPGIAYRPLGKRNPAIQARVVAEQQQSSLPPHAELGSLDGAPPRGKEIAPAARAAGASRHAFLCSATDPFC